MAPSLLERTLPINPDLIREHSRISMRQGGIAVVHVHQKRGKIQTDGIPFGRLGAGLVVETLRGIRWCLSVVMVMSHSLVMEQEHKLSSGF